MGERCIGKDLEERDRNVIGSRYSQRDSNPELPKRGVQIYRHVNLLSKTNVFYIAPMKKRNVNGRYPVIFHKLLVWSNTSDPRDRAV